MSYLISRDKATLNLIKLLFVFIQYYQNITKKIMFLSQISYT